MNHDYSRSFGNKSLLCLLIGAAIASAAATAFAASPHDLQATTPSTNRNKRSAMDFPAGARAKKEKNKKHLKNNKVTTLKGITVHGLRASLAGAEAIKKNSRMIVDAVVAQNIGKLPDRSVADALQRIPGVQVSQTAQGQTGNVLIRGLPNISTTLDGRQILGPGGRTISLQSIPASMVHVIRVYKTNDASMITGGLAGTVDLRTFMPFDFKGKKLAFNLKEVRTAETGNSKPTASLLLSDRWNTRYGKLGLLLDAGVQERSLNRTNVLYQNNNDNVLTGGKLVKGMRERSLGGAPVRDSRGNLVIGNQNYGENYNISTRKQPAAHYGIQWKPTQNLEFFLTGLYTWNYETRWMPWLNSNPQNQVPPSALSTSNTCPVIRQSTSMYFNENICPQVGATYTGTYTMLGSTQSFQTHGHNMDNTVGIKWHGGNLNLSTSVDRNSSSSFTNVYVLGETINTYPNPQTTIARYPNIWEIVGSPQLNLANRYLHTLGQTWTEGHARQLAWRGDGIYDVDGNFIRTLQFGLRYASDKVEAMGAHSRANTPKGLYAGKSPVAPGLFLPPNPADSSLALLGRSAYCETPGSSQFPEQNLDVCRSYLNDNIARIREFFGLPSGRLPSQKSRFFSTSEKNYAAYGQINYGGFIGGMNYRGVLGARIEHVRRELRSFTKNGQSGEFAPNVSDTSQTTVLPNIMFTLGLTRRIQLKLSADETLQYPSFAQLDPSLTLNSFANRVGTGSGGNPNLSPIKARNYDGAIAWYFNRDGYVSGDLFYKSVTGYIEDLVEERNIGGHNYDISGPESSGRGHLDGAELAYQQFFSFLPGAWGGLGLQVNFTYIGGSLRTPSNDSPGFIWTSFQNVSTYNYNVVLMYQKNGFSARVAYNFRSKYPEAFLPTSNILGNNIQAWARPANMVDAEFSYDVNHNFAVMVTAQNVFNAHFQDFVGSGKNIPYNYSFEGRTVGVGVRLDF